MKENKFVDTCLEDLSYEEIKDKYQMIIDINQTMGNNSDFFNNNEG